MDRPSIDRTNPAIFKAYNKAALEATKAAADAGLGRDLIELVNTRVSQVNGCVRCLSIHAPAARKHGVTQDLLDLLPAWRETGAFTPEQMAALGLAEALTALDGSLPSAQKVAVQIFSPDQLAALEWCIITINSFNRISIASGHGPLHRSGDQQA